MLIPHQIRVRASPIGNTNLRAGFHQVPPIWESNAAIGAYIQAISWFIFFEPPFYLLEFFSELLVLPVRAEIHEPEDILVFLDDFNLTDDIIKIF